MKIVLVSDIHSNSHALEAVICDARDHGGEDYWCLGDVIGYGASPLECIRLIRPMANDGRWEAVCGNHEEVLVWMNEYFMAFPEKQIALKVAVEKNQTEVFGDFQFDLRKVCEAYGVKPRMEVIDTLLRNYTEMVGDPDGEWYLGWVREKIQESGDRKSIFGDVGEGIYRVMLHGSVRQIYREYTDEPGYKLFLKDHMQGFVNRHIPTYNKIVFLGGHTHVPMCLCLNGSEEAHEIDFIYSEQIEMIRNVYWVNPGSVGHPGDGDPRPSYVILDTDYEGKGSITFHRVPPEKYPPDQVDRREHPLKKKGYPKSMSDEIRSGQMRKPYDEEFIKKLKKRAGEHWTGEK